MMFPLLAIATLAGLSVLSATSSATSAEQARQLVVLGGRAADLVERLQSERAAAALVFASGTDAGPVDDYRQWTDASDAAVQRFREQRRRSFLPAAFRPALSRIDGEFGDLRPIRQQVLSTPDAVASVVTFRYQVIIGDLLRFRESLSQVDAVRGIAAGLRATAALGDATEALGMVQTTLVRSLAIGRITPATQGEIVAEDASFTKAITEFRSLAPAGWISRYDRVVAGPEALVAERLHGIVARVQPGPLPALGTDAAGWVSAVRARIRQLHTLAAQLDSQLVAQIVQQRDAARRTVSITAVGVGVAMLCMIVFGAIVARSLTRSLTRLRAAAETIAHTRLPEMVDQVSTGTVDLDRTGRLVTEITESIPVAGRDEVGQVAAAFNAVTASAVRLAGEQAALRGGVRAIFNSLSRRGQRRLNVVMTSIDSLQAKETDPDHLALLFRLDHAATGLRRLTAGLQVLAGGRAGLARPKPMGLPDVVRAAQSEIDQYRRIDIGTVDSDVQLHGEPVEEVIHLLAELLDNAARFSAPNTLVVVDGRRVGDRLHIQITDEGKGMTEAQLAATRDRIANPHRLDHHAASQMGLPVVAAIADRLGISVELRSAEPHGTRVDITLPPRLFLVVPADARSRKPGGPATAETGSPARSPESSALAAAEASLLERPSAPREAPAGAADIDPTVGGPMPGDGEASVELLALGSGWPSAQSWPSRTPTPQPSTPSPVERAAPAEAADPAVPAPAVPEPAVPEPAVPEPAVAEPAVAEHAVPEPAGSPGPSAAALVAPAYPEPTPEIYRELKRAWLAGDTTGRHEVTPDAGEPGSEPTGFTGSGLPRRPGGAAWPPTVPAGADQAGEAAAVSPPAWWSADERSETGWPATEPPPDQYSTGGQAGPGSAAADRRRSRDSEQLRRRYAGLGRGLTAVRRPSVPEPPVEEQQP